MPATCRTCRHLIVKPNAAGGIRMHRDGVYPCGAPCPDVRALLPHSWSIDGPREKYMSPDEGAGCPAYEKKEKTR